MSTNKLNLISLDIRYVTNLKNITKMLLTLNYIIFSFQVKYYR